MGQFESNVSNISRVKDNANLTKSDLERIQNAYIKSFTLPDEIDRPWKLLNQEWRDARSVAESRIIPSLKKLTLCNKRVVQRDFSNHHHSANSSFSQPSTPNCILPQSTKAPNYPMTDGTLSKNGVFNMGPDSPSEHIDTNKVNIHPIFHFKNFDTSLLGAERAHQAWLAMGPALALATKWLAAPEARRGFWHRIYFGERTPHASRPGAFCLSPSRQESDFVGASSLFENNLLSLAEQVKFFWTPQNATSAKTPINGVTFLTFWSAITFIPNLKSSDALSFLTKNPQTVSHLSNTFSPRIGLSTRYLFHLLSTSNLRADPSANTRLQFSLACLLCHELSHLIHASRAPLGTPEPYAFPGDKMPELGISWEFYLLGGRLESSIGSSYIGYLATRSWRFACSYPAINVVLPMWWVKDWFLKTIWEDEFENFRISELWGRGREAGENMGWRCVSRYDMKKRSWFDLVCFKRERTWVEDRGEVKSGVRMEGLFRPELTERWEEWYEYVSDEDVGAAREQGNHDSITGSWGDYGELLGGECC